LASGWILKRIHVKKLNRHELAQVAGTHRPASRKSTHSLLVENKDSVLVWRKSKFFSDLPVPIRDYIVVD
jgi:hypothetical protein